MNLIDLGIGVVALFAICQGWRRGCILQVVSLAGLLMAVWLGARFGTQAGALCRLDEPYAAPAGFLLVLLATLCLTALAGQLIRKVFHFAGFGIVDRLLGVGLAGVKYLLLLGLLFAAFDRMNTDYHLVDPAPIRASKLYRPVADLAPRLFPFVEQLGSQAAEQLHRYAGPEAPEAGSGR